MIGFSEQPGADRGHAHEDAETRDLDKRQLYNMVSNHSFLPPITTKGVTRDYLVRAYRNEVFLVRIFDLKHFEVDLTPAMTKRAGIPNNSLLVRKIDGLLDSRGLPRLGFDDFEPPDEVAFADQNWLYRVARFIDHHNILQFFEIPVEQGDPSLSGNNPVHRTHFGRLKASKFFHRLPEARRDRKLWDSLHSISTLYRAYLCQRLIVEKLNTDIESATKRRTDLERSLENLVSQAGITYTTIERPGLRADSLIQREQVPQEVRDLIALNCRLIKYIYCTDSVLDAGDREVQDITRESLEHLNIDLGAWTPVPASQIPSPSPAASNKQTPRKETPRKDPPRNTTMQED